MTKLSDKIISELVTLADDFDQSGQFNMAAKVDDTIKSFARGRPKAPLKGLDDDVKESLITFLHNAGKRLKASQGDLQELFRRLRYFDQAESIKPLGLEKALKDMGDTQACIDTAKEKLYGMTFGGGKAGMGKLLDKLDDGGDNLDDAPAHSPLDFFDSRQGGEEPAQEPVEEEPSSEEKEEEEEALTEFWKHYDELEAFEDDNKEEAE